MPARLVALDEGPDIPLDRAMVVVGRHPQCDARLDSLRVSRHHCCMSHDHGDVIVRDLGSTNGIRINGQRVEFGRLRPGDELSIAHIRYRLDNGQGHEVTVADGTGARLSARGAGEGAGAGVSGLAAAPGPFEGFPPDASPPGGVLFPAVGGAIPGGDQRLAAAVREALAREALPPSLADRCRIQVIVQVPDGGTAAAGLGPAAGGVPEGCDGCRPDSSR